MIDDTPISQDDINSAGLEFADFAARVYKYLDRLDNDIPSYSKEFSLIREYVDYSSSIISSSMGVMTAEIIQAAKNSGAIPIGSIEEAFNESMKIKRG